MIFGEYWTRARDDTAWLAAGSLVTKISLFAKISKPLQALCFSATLLFHMIPAITDGLLRLPVGDPVLTDPQDPLLMKFYLGFFVVFLVRYVMQFLWFKKQEYPLEVSTDI